MSDHTPGPWVWSRGRAWGAAGVEGPIGRLKGPEDTSILSLGDTETYYPTAGEEPTEADARLIAAAWLLPELVEALDNQLDYCYQSDGEDFDSQAEPMRTSRLVIRRAREALGEG